MLTDNLFQPFRRMSTEAGGPAVSRARPVRVSPGGLRTLKKPKSDARLVSMVPLRVDTRCTSKYEHQRHNTRGDVRATRRYVPDQDYHGQVLRMDDRRDVAVCSYLAALEGVQGALKHGQVVTVPQ